MTSLLFDKGKSVDVMASVSRVSQNFVTMSREWAEVGPLPVLVSGAAIPMMDVRSLISGKIFSRIPASNRESGILFLLGQRQIEVHHAQTTVRD